jgi:hypothetical protein
MTHRVESIFGDWIAFEELWDIDLEAVTSKIVGKELRRPCRSRLWRAGTTYTIILKLEAKDVRHIEDGLVLWVIGGWCGNVCFDTVDLLIRPLSDRILVV